LISGEIILGVTTDSIIHKIKFKYNKQSEVGEKIILSGRNSVQ